MENNPYFYLLGFSLLGNVIFAVSILYNYRERKRIHALLNEVNQSISQKNQAITEQAAKLAEAYENLWRINQRLEEEARLRTNNLAIQQRKLVDHTHFYTHKLRGTLASMMGLLLLAEKEDMSEGLKDLFELMRTCTHQLEKTISDFTEKLNEDV